MLVTWYRFQLGIYVLGRYTKSKLFVYVPSKNFVTLDGTHYITIVVNDEESDNLGTDYFKYSQIWRQNSSIYGKINEKNMEETTMKLPVLAKPVMRKISTVKIKAGISQSDCSALCSKKQGLAWKLCMNMCNIKESAVTT